MQNYHAVVWLDHHEARVFFFDRHDVKEVDLATTKPHSHLHHKAGNMSGKRNPEDQAFFHSIVEALKPATEWLVLGPGQAKAEFVKHIEHHDKQLTSRVLGVETVDHPTDKQIVAHARAYFRALDPSRPIARR